VTKALADLSVPNTMQDIIMARLDRLGGDGKRMVQLASVIGRQFVVRLLERVAGMTGRLDGLLAELKALEIIYEHGLLAEPGYIFKHAVIQDVAYGSLLVQSPKDLHRGVGEAIEELYRDRPTEHFAELAHHFTCGEDWSKAMQYSTLAGDQGALVFANVEAKKHYFSALEAAAKLSSPPDWETLLALHSKYAEILLNLSEYDDAAAEYLEALELARRAGDRRREMEAMVWLSNVYDFSHRGEPAIDYNERALAIARELGDREFQATCLAPGSGSGAVGGVRSSRPQPMLKKLFVCPRRSRTSRCSPSHWCFSAEHYSGAVSWSGAWPTSRKALNWLRRFIRASPMATASSRPGTHTCLWATTRRRCAGISA
jgi:predicted ATPase